MVLRVVPSQGARPRPLLPHPGGGRRCAPPSPRLPCPGGGRQDSVPRRDCALCCLEDAGSRRETSTCPGDRQGHSRDIHPSVLEMEGGLVCHVTVRGFAATPAVTALYRRWTGGSVRRVITTGYGRGLLRRLIREREEADRSASLPCLRRPAQEPCPGDAKSRRGTLPCPGDGQGHGRDTHPSVLEIDGGLVRHAQRPPCLREPTPHPERVSHRALYVGLTSARDPAPSRSSKPRVTAGTRSQSWPSHRLARGQPQLPAASALLRLPL